ncbi:glycosyltransferase family 9 protein [bacterium]|nr:glycosyltransferase family 9 protein [bacterium]
MKNSIKNLVQSLIFIIDYLFYLVFNPFKFKKIKLNEIRKILIIDLLHVGDIIVTTPVIKNLRNTFPDAKIDFCLQKKYKDLIDEDINLDNLIFYDKNFLKNIKGKYDLVVLLHPGSLKISLDLLRSKIKYRIGCSHIGAVRGRGYFLTRKVTPRIKQKSLVEYNLDVLKLLKLKIKNLKPQLYCKQDFRLKKGFNVVVHVSGNKKSNKWLNERWAKVLDYMVEKYKVNIYFTGVKSDLEDIKQINSLMKNKAEIMAGKTNLKELMALIKNSDMYLGIDSGPMHIASTFNKKIIVLFGPTNLKFWKPYSKDLIMIKKSSFMRSILVDDVKRALGSILK